MMVVEPCAIIRDPVSLADALRRERLRRGWSQLELDDRAGLQEGYTGKLERPEAAFGRTLGPVSMPLILEALGLAIVVVRVRRRALPRPPPPEQRRLGLTGGAMVRRGDPRRNRGPKAPAPEEVQAEAVTEAA